MIAVVHHSDYVTEAPVRSTYRWGKNGAIRDLLLAAGNSIVWHSPNAAPRGWLEAVHDAAYVAEVIAAAVPREKERRIGFPVTANVARRSQLVSGVSIGVQKGPPIGVQKGPPSSSSVTGMTGAPFALVAA